VVDPAGGDPARRGSVRYSGKRLDPQESAYGRLASQKDVRQVHAPEAITALKLNSRLGRRGRVMVETCRWCR